MIRSPVTAGGVDEVAPNLQRRSRRLLTVCFVASVALHLALLAVLPGFVEDRAPLEARVLDVVLLNPDTPPAVTPEPPPSAADLHRPSQQKRMPGTEQRSRPPLKAEEPGRSETKTPPAPSDPPPVAKPASDRPAPPASETHGLPEPRAEATRPADAPVITPPTFNATYLRNPAPRYPLIARRNGEQGTVTLRVLVTREGVPASVSVERTSGSGHLDSAALETVKTWRFVPARQGKQPIEAWVLVPIVFRLEGTS